MKLRVYVDTSVISALHDERWPERRIETREFWEQAAQYEVVTSELGLEELRQTTDKELRRRLEALAKELHVFAVTEEMREVASQYVQADVFTPVMWNDAVHVAAAVVSRCDVLLSWNFRHLVNRRRRARVNDVNVSLGLPAIDIVAPPEL